MPPCPTCRSPHFVMVSPAGCSSSRSSARQPNRRPPSGPRARRGHGRRRWIARGATPTPPSTAPQRDSRNAPSAAPRKDCGPARSPTRVGRGMPAAMEYRCALTATMNSRSDIGAPGVITPPHRGAPATPSKPAPTRSPPRSWPATATPSRWRIAVSPPGRGCGAKGSRCSAQACSSLRCNRNATPPAAGFTGPAPTPPRCLSTACAAHACQKPLLSAPTTAHSADCAAIVTSCPPLWPACVEFVDSDDPHAARVNYRLAHALRDGLASQQEWEGSVNRYQPPTPSGDGLARTGSHPVASAEYAAPSPPPNSPRPQRGRGGTSRKQPAPKLIGAV